MVYVEKYIIPTLILASTIHLSIVLPYLSTESLPDVILKIIKFDFECIEQNNAQQIIVKCLRYHRKRCVTHVTRGENIFNNKIYIGDVASIRCKAPGSEVPWRVPRGTRHTFHFLKTWSGVCTTRAKDRISLC